jgi:hypothetical protein
MAKTSPTWLGTNDRYARLRRIETLDPVADYREIKELFSYDFQSALIVQAASGFLFTFSSPRMSRILSASGQAGHHTAKRFVDTALLTSAVVEHGLEPGDGREAAKRVNAMHRQYDIHPDDFVAVGCESPLMALSLAEQFGWREVTDKERAALRNYHNAESRAFGSHKQIPDTIEEMARFWEEYLDTQLAFEPQNKELADALLRFTPNIVPAPMRPFINGLMTAQVDPRILEACGLPIPSRARKSVSHAFFRAMGKADPRPDPAPGTEPTDPLKKLAEQLYPSGWSIQTLGTHLQSHGSVNTEHQKTQRSDR